MDNFGLLQMPPIGGLLSQLPGVQQTPSMPMPHDPYGFGPMNGIAPAHAAAPLPIQQTPPGRLSRFHENVLKFLNPTPQGFDGLLTPEEIKGERPGFLQSIITGANDPSYSDRLDNLVKHKMLAEQIGEHNLQFTQGQQEQQRVRQVRGQIAQAFPPAPNENPQQQVQRLMSMYTAYAQAGDTEMAGKLGEVLKSMGDVLNGPKPTSLEHVDSGDHTDIIDPRTGRVVSTLPKGVVPKTAAEVDVGQRFQADQKNKILDDYARDTKDFHQVMAGWDVLQGALKNPSLATPFAITDAYARITNPGAIVRPTTLEMIEHMGSLGQRMKKAWEKSATGQLPADITEDFKHTLYNIVREHKDQYDRIRKQALSRGKQTGVSGLDDLLQDYDLKDPFASAPAAATAGAGSASKVRGFLKP